jgi:hypothetical protein
MNSNNNIFRDLSLPDYNNNNNNNNKIQKGKNAATETFK